MGTLNELWEAYKTLCADMLAERTAPGHWEGRLASSALATATAIGALSLVLLHRKASERREGFSRSVPTPTSQAGRAFRHQPDLPDPSDVNSPVPSAPEQPGVSEPQPPGPSEPEPTGQSAPKQLGISQTVQSSLSKPDQLGTPAPKQPAISEVESVAPSAPERPGMSEPEPTGLSAMDSPDPSRAEPTGPLATEIARLIYAGLEWLARTQNPDGGWGDTDRSPSNIATTMLVRAAVHLADLLDWNCLGIDQAGSAGLSGDQAGLSGSAGVPGGPSGSTGDQTGPSHLAGDRDGTSGSSGDQLGLSGSTGDQTDTSGVAGDRACQTDSSGRQVGPYGSNGYQVGLSSPAGVVGGSPQAGQPVPFGVQKPTQRFARLLDRAAQYIEQQGGLEGLRRRYGKDQTFAVPILTMYALAGLTGWEEVRPLPFEWAVLPHSVLGWVRLPVVSYAIPALVAMGQARFFHLPPRNPLLRWLRAALVEKTLQVLEAKQPASGGFLEAVPLTSFVLMALASTGRAWHPVVRRGVEFLLHTFRPEGAWPIDANLATWVTTLSLNALLGPGFRTDGPGTQPGRPGVGPEGAGTETEPPASFLPPEDSISRQGAFALAAMRREAARRCLPWLLECQHKTIHPFTYSAPGGWGWSDLPGAVPDADDTSGALLALAAICRELHGALSADQRRRILQAAALGLRWLLDLQNRDGGWPTFCRGWGALPFDRSATDLTAHALRALAAWEKPLLRENFSEAFSAGRYPVSAREIRRAIRRGLRFLARSQNPDGSWTPLWFGNAYWPGEENPIYGTARVLLAYRDLGLGDDPAAQRGRAWLLAHQNPDGGWGGRPRWASPFSDRPSELPPNNQEQNHKNMCSSSAGQGFQPAPPVPYSNGADWPSCIGLQPVSTPLAQPPSCPRCDWQSSVEETALALEALLTDPRAADILGPLADSRAAGAVGQPASGLLRSSVDPSRQNTNVYLHALQSPPGDSEGGSSIRAALERALAWLVRAVQEGRHRRPEPIGLYFARLWYYEKMYPITFALSALGQAIVCLQAAPGSET